MFYSDDFLLALQDDPIKGVFRICSSVSNGISPGEGWFESDFGLLSESYALVMEVNNADLLPMRFNLPLLRPDLNMSEACGRMKAALDSTEEQLKKFAMGQEFNKHRERFRKALGNGFFYEFSQGDLDRVQELITSLREEINNSSVFEEGHKDRMLRRLERLQSELHKKMADMDRFWGLIGDAGVALGKFGSDAKPFVDRIRELTDIVWRTQSRAEELPSASEPPAISYGGANTTGDPPIDA